MSMEYGLAVCGGGPFVEAVATEAKQITFIEGVEPELDPIIVCAQDKPEIDEFSEVIRPASPHIRTYHVVRELALSEYLPLEFTRTMFADGSQSGKCDDRLAHRLAAALLRIRGITEVNVFLYYVEVVKGEAFSWEPLQRGIHEAIAREVYDLSWDVVPLERSQTWDSDGDIGSSDPPGPGKKKAAVVR